MTTFKEKIHHFLLRKGIRINRFPDGVYRQKRNLMKMYDINLILDVGANEGQSGEYFREIGYRGEILSFEPLNTVFGILQKKTASDPRWSAYNYALGDFDGTSLINISGNSQSSSILGMLDAHKNYSAQSAYIGTQEISVKRLDSVWPGLAHAGKNILLKMDVQGFEKKVLDGATVCLKDIAGIQLELSLERLYDDELLFEEMNHYLESLGYALCLLESGIASKKNGKLMQLDGTYFRLKA